MDERLDDPQLFLSYASTIPCADLAVPEVSRALPGDSAWNSPRGRGIASSAAPWALFVAPSAIVLPSHWLSSRRQPSVVVASFRRRSGGFYRGGTAEKRFSAEKIIYVQKRSERAHFLVWPARTSLEGAGSGRGAIFYVHWRRLRVRTPPCASVSFCNARKQARCARLHWQKL